VPTGDSYLIRWDSVAGKRYRILRTTNILKEGLTPIRTGITATQPLNVITDTPPQSSTLIYGIGLAPRPLSPITFGHPRYALERRCWANSSVQEAWAKPPARGRLFNNVVAMSGPAL